ncbi:hypothetical protein LYNGBM3L_70940 [Moorena producens 3L]|uniref:Uncharacterized protein n=1 Tax=Moorena producens 3L TaxID=489825 RepID=F4Y3F6_9CYAN|nr:hypothetical protein [Moorena producens 3L]EGJ28632.1 hypothetical protein LYNGBM3L_70940 [Moorena producens 3L]
MLKNAIASSKIIANRKLASTDTNRRHNRLLLFNDELFDELFDELSDELFDELSDELSDEFSKVIFSLVNYLFSE